MTSSIAITAGAQSIQARRRSDRVLSETGLSSRAGPGPSTVSVAVLSRHFLALTGAPRD